MEVYMKRYFDERDNGWEEVEVKVNDHMTRWQIDIFEVSLDINDEKPLKPYKRISLPGYLEGDFRKIYKSIIRHYIKTKEYVKRQVWAWKETEDWEWIDLSTTWDYDSHEKYEEALY
jgi:hypothetical protein